MNGAYEAQRMMTMQSDSPFVWILARMHVVGCRMIWNESDNETAGFAIISDALIFREQENGVAALSMTMVMILYSTT